MASLSRSLRRACLDTRWSLPPSFLLPWSAGLATVSHTTEPGNVPDAVMHSKADMPGQKSSRTISQTKSSLPQDLTQSPSRLPAPSSQSSPATLSPSIRELLPVLQAQGSHYITAHIYDRPYLLTAGDTVRLPFLMHGVEPGDVLRLNRASNIGSRDFTLKAASKGPRQKSPTATTTAIVDPTPGSYLTSTSRVMPTPRPSASMERPGAEAKTPVPHFVANQAKGKMPYLDDRLFVCRAVVMGVESEPLRTKEKTKRRNRKTKTVKSKHRFTVLRIKELRVRSLEEIESGIEE